MPRKLKNGSVTIPECPANVGATGADLWRRLHEQFVINDQAQLELLMQICCAASRAAECAAAIARDGVTVTSRSGLKAHPLVQVEISCRQLVSNGLRKLGMLDQPVRDGPGRPPSGPFGWKPDAEH